MNPLDLPLYVAAGTLVVIGVVAVRQYRRLMRHIRALPIEDRDG